MLEFRGFNDYTVEVYKGGTLFGRYYAVTDLKRLTLWFKINPVYWKWTSIRVYHRFTNTFIGQYSRGGEIPAKPKHN
jgi:hypothetical protein